MYLSIFSLNRALNLDLVVGQKIVKNIGIEAKTVLKRLIDSYYRILSPNTLLIICELKKKFGENFTRNAMIFQLKRCYGLEVSSSFSGNLVQISLSKHKLEVHSK